MNDRQGYVAERLGDRIEELETREKNLAKIVAVLRVTLDRVKRDEKDVEIIELISKINKEADGHAISHGLDDLILVEVSALIEVMQKNMNTKQNGAP